MFTQKSACLSCYPGGSFIEKAALAEGEWLVLWLAFQRRDMLAGNNQLLC